MSFVVVLISLLNKEMISSYGTKEDAVCHAAGFILETINTDFDTILSHSEKKENLFLLIEEYEKQNYKEVIRLYNESVKAYDNDPDVVIFESKKNFNMSASHKTLCNIKDKLDELEKTKETENEQEKE